MEAYLYQKEILMPVYIQYDFFKETTEVDILKSEVEAYKTTLDKVRKGTYAEIGALRKMVFTQKDEIDELKFKIEMMSKVGKKERLVQSEARE